MLRLGIECQKLIRKGAVNYYRLNDTHCFGQSPGTPVVPHQTQSKCFVCIAISHVDL